MLGTEVRLTPSTMMAPWSLVRTPISSRPRPVVWGTWPMVSSTWLPSTVRPSSRWTTPRSPTRSTLAALARFTVSRPRRSNTSSMTRAASSSWVGRIRSRLQMKVTWAPKRRNAVAYSAPVAPAPTTTRCSGTSRSLYTSWLDRMTSPSAGAVSMRRGSDPVGQDLLADVLGLGQGQVAHPPHDRRQVDLVAGHLLALHALEVDPEAGSRLQGVERLSRGQQGLGRHAVPEHAGPAQPLVVDDRDLGPQVGRDQGSFVPTRPPTNDDHPHRAMVPSSRALGSDHRLSVS